MHYKLWILFKCVGLYSVKEHASPPNVSVGVPLIAKSAVNITCPAVQL